MSHGKAAWLCRDLPKHLVNIKETTFLLSNTAENEFLFAFSLNLIPSYTVVKSCVTAYCDVDAVQSTT